MEMLILTNINSGIYYDYLKSVIEESLNNFLSYTTFQMLVPLIKILIIKNQIYMKHKVIILIH